MESDETNLQHIFTEIFLNKKKLDDSEFLESIKNGERLLFSNSKSTFILGSQKNLDFVIKKEGIASKHSLFFKGLMGITLIPMPNCLVKVNDLQISQSIKLTHGAFVTFGNDENYIFKETNKKDMLIEKKQIKKADHFFKKPNEKKIKYKKISQAEKNLLIIFLLMTVSFLTVLVMAI